MNTVLTAEVIANAFAAEIERRLKDVPDQVQHPDKYVTCSAGRVRCGPLQISASEKTGPVESLIRRFSDKLDQMVEMLVKVSDCKQPIFLSAPRLPAGIQGAAHGFSGPVELRLTECYDVQNDQFVTYLDADVMCLVWRNPVGK